MSGGEGTVLAALDGRGSTSVRRTGVRLAFPVALRGQPTVRDTTATLVGASTVQAVRPSRSVVAPALKRWLENSEDEDRRTVVVRLRSTADPRQVGMRLTEMGARFQPPATGALVCAVTPRVLRELAQQPWVIAVDAPKPLFPRADSAG